ncbi:MAG: phage tail protein [Caldicoprobacter oshimai]
MPIAVFGPKAFEVTQDKIYTFDGLQYTSSLNTEKQDAAGKKPSTYNKGPALDTFSITIMLDAALGVNPRREIEEWIAIKDAGVAYPFVLGNRPWGSNKWLLVEVQVIAQVIDNAGNILKAEISLKFDEYVRPGSAAAKSTSGGSSKKSSNKTSAPGIQLPPLTGPVNLLGAQDKAVTKRKNPNMMAY